MCQYSRFCATLALALCLGVCKAEAVTLYATATRNSDPPPEAMGLDGWNLQGFTQGNLATPIAPQYFIAATHIRTVTSFTFQGTDYPIDTAFNGVGYSSDPNNDLTIYKIQGIFPTWATLYDAVVDGPELGKTLTFIGRGGPRGDPVVVNGSTVGWQWAYSDKSVESWGQNVVSSFGDFSSTSTSSLLAFNFDADGLDNEAGIATGDSSGGEFIYSGGVWKLAGVNHGAGGLWENRGTGSADFNGNIFDARGLWQQDDNLAWNQVADPGYPVPAASYGARISTEIAWINSVTGLAYPTPEPSSWALLSVAAIGLIAYWRRKSALVR
jgi:hypothetical protein